MLTFFAVTFGAWFVYAVTVYWLVFWRGPWRTAYHPLLAWLLRRLGPPTPTPRARPPPPLPHRPPLGGGGRWGGTAPLTPPPLRHAGERIVRRHRGARASAVSSPPCAPST